MDKYWERNPTNFTEKKFAEVLKNLYNKIYLVNLYNQKAYDKIPYQNDYL